MSVAINYSNHPKFDIVEFIQRLKKANFTQEQSELLAQETDRILEAAISNSREVKAEIKQELHSDELATKGHVRESELRLQKDIEVIRKEIVTNRMELEVKMALIESHLLKWMLGIGIASATVVLGGTFGMLKLMLHI